jgi:membrane dipeptidase
MAAPKEGGSTRTAASRIYGDALVWDDHAGFESRPDADLSQLRHWREAGVTYLSVNVGYDVRPWDNTVKTLAAFRRQIAGEPERFLLVERAADVRRAKAEGKLAITFDIEGMESLDGEVDMVSAYYDLGVRHMLFAYNRNNRAGGGCQDQDVGLTGFGRAVVREMNRVGMVVDCSHSGYRTTMEAMEVSSAPVVFSHSNPRALCDHPRNIRDDQIKACAATGGVIGINGVSLFLGDNDIRPERFVDHVAYVAELVGAEHLGLGLDYMDETDGLTETLARNQTYWPASLGYDQSIEVMAPDTLPRITELLLERGFSQTEVEGVLGENFLKVAERVWK